jgi:hypothetical protein
MNTSLVGADPATHLKIMLVASMAVMVVVSVGLAANRSAMERPELRNVVKASVLTEHADRRVSNVSSFLRF